MHLNHAVAPSLKKKLVNNMMVNTFSVSVDGSNDVRMTKMNPLTVSIFEAVEFLDMCTASAVEAIYSMVNGKLAELLNTVNPWKLCRY